MKKAGALAGLPHCVGSIYRLLPVLFAMYAPPGRDRLEVSRTVRRNVVA